MLLMLTGTFLLGGGTLYLGGDVDAEAEIDLRVFGGEIEEGDMDGSISVGYIILFGQKVKMDLQLVYQLL